MTRRARLLLEALADGPLTRARIFERTGYMMSNNGAAELRAAGYTVVCTRAGREYVYEIVADGVLSGPAGVAPTLPVDPHATLTEWLAGLEPRMRPSVEAQETT